VGWWKEEHFSAADMDNDGFLNLTEFNEYYFLSATFFKNLFLPSIQYLL
jgi:Ca2+-binding EF-hand superfamily protein